MPPPLTLLTLPPLGAAHAGPPRQALVDKLKGISPELLLATTKHGDLHLQVVTTGA